MRKLELSSDDKIRQSILTYFNKNHEAKFIHRLHGILLTIENQNNTCDGIARIFGQSPRSVSSWIKKVNKAGAIEVLRSDKLAGRNKKLSDAEFELFYEDECHFKQTLSITRAWYPKGSCPEIKSPVDRYEMSITVF
ncbi:MAG: hypothetical protein WCP32_12260 [Bacteroidota bacterium]